MKDNASTILDALNMTVNPRSGYDSRAEERRFARELSLNRYVIRKFLENVPDDLCVFEILEALEEPDADESNP
jgi:hypothetical protein